MATRRKFGTNALQGRSCRLCGLAADYLALSTKIAIEFCTFCYF
ncbi:hypothetical protein HMPREF1579_01274 [Gardnerella vaginalis JCP8066]|uniref:Uncharacterized protein n=1 Tax=Gardnerella pickettii JCP7719 TaxID=1261061 RepID=S4GU21_9BIFI|nr:hypothetical protein HMPREF1576_01126 [Gardnerella pickettii JCP7719]EPI58390.1 hypothetical protein HMPREF1579_01274 [Gardnerella vaginalis JCP8066]